MEANHMYRRRRTGLSWATSVLVVFTVAAVGRMAQAEWPDFLLDMPFSFVPGADDQPGGPTYDYRVSSHEITNAQYVDFLNDALTNLDNERGAYLYFDTDSGDVYVHSQALGAIGTEGTGALILDVSVGSVISYDGDAYVVEAGFEEHPVVGVSWFGAVKFCNWLTIAADLAPAERAYTEGPRTNLYTWHPATISTDDWLVRDLDADEREELLTRLGFRLPMTDGAATASAYNEWYKAAAWDAGTSTAYLYGFGADTITDPDANYRNSGDPFDNGTTPVGYYDGSDHGGTYQTNPDLNYYGLRDASGNVWEWVQDKGSTTDRRGNRGGGWNTPSAGLRTDFNSERVATEVSDTTGFRIAQRVVDAVLLTPQVDLLNAGPWGGPWQDETVSLTYRISNISDTAIVVTASTDVDWLVLTDAPQSEELLPGAERDFDMAIDPFCGDGLEVGPNTGLVTVLNETSEVSISRTVLLTISEPLNLTPTASFVASMRFADEYSPPPEKTYTFASVSDLDVTWTADWQETGQEPSGLPWLTLNGDANAGGDISPQGTQPITLAIVPAPEPETYLEVGSYSASVTFRDECTGSTWLRNVTLQILPWFTLTPGGTLTSTGPEGGPFTPVAQDLTLTNLDAEPLDWTLLPDPDPLADWLDVQPQAGTVPGSGVEMISVEILDEAEFLQAGSYTQTLHVEHDFTPFRLTREIELTIHSWIDPDDSVTFTRPVGGDVEPATYSYDILGNGIGERYFEVSIASDDPHVDVWLTADPIFGAVLGSEASVEVTLTPNQVASQLPAGAYTVTITFTDWTDDPPTFIATRRATLNVEEASFDLSLELVPGSDGQPDNPSHNFRIGKYEVTNTLFVKFLNDTLNNPDGIDRHDVGEGRVVLAGDDTVLFDASLGDDIEYVDEHWQVKAGRAQYPVVGVSWYGAARFCNWLTVLQGMTDPDERIYIESSFVANWGAVAQDPAALVQYSGFRLPLDAGLETEGAFNEWYKAAAWLESTELYADYGFGRDVLENRDANFLDSEDPDEPGPTSVGYYDGAKTVEGGATVTRDTNNGYGLYDMTGNVAEWLHDVGDVVADRAVRGGHFNNTSSSQLLRTDQRDSVPADDAYNFVGLRVVQALPKPLTEVDVLPTEPQHVVGIAGGPYGASAFAWALLHEGPYTLDDISISLSQDWLELSGPTKPLVPPGEAVPVTLSLNEAADDLPPSPVPAQVGCVLVPAADEQPGGPTYDYYISKFEITNAQYRAFLQDAYDNARSGAPDERSAFMYFDTDSGSVYVNDEEDPAYGTAGGSGALATPLYDASVGRIALVGDAFAVESGFETHPVVGVSWYGALKYCNWLTLKEGIDAALRAYTEAASDRLAGWHPVVVDDQTWQDVGLDEVARHRLVRESVGYRLPMDDDQGGASPYNEWYKAAAWDRSHSVERIYGFGRDALTSADANFLGSGDTEDDQTTGYGFFDGVRLLHDGETKTRNTDNSYDLYDLCGNAAEWTQDFFTSGDSCKRALRGGSFRDDASDPALTNTGRQAAFPEQVGDDVGFRVVRTVGHVHQLRTNQTLTGVTLDRYLILHLREPLIVNPGRTWN
jgi:formylglycine-generating enzyme required for sulfatase activity